MNFGASAPITPVKVPGVKKVVSTPGDAMQAGIHSDLRASSAHKQQVSSVLHLKKESAGHRGNPTAFGTGNKKFAFKKLKVK